MTNAITVNFQRYTSGTETYFNALIAFNTLPSGRSCKNSKAAVSFSINEILTKRSKRVNKQRSVKSNFLSAPNKDLVSLPFDEREFIKVPVR